ncbi:hypothetical protein ACIOHS_26945 [Streptomyces sp. NPDC088253]|uniref:hypothetical protein n=1 Tax=Streptomyces sp. NPDC088253 TaxID=3365846 RepID=UPI0038019E71
MSDSSEERASEAKEAKLVSIPEMPDLLVAAGLKRVGPARIRQLAAEPGFPAPAYERGRLRLWNWAEALQFFSSRVVRQGERTDLKRDQEGTSDEPAGGDGQ